MNKRRQHLENNQKLQDWSTEGLPQRSKLTQFSNVYCLSPQCFAIPLLLSASMNAQVQNMKSELLQIECKLHRESASCTYNALMDQIYLK